MVSAPGTPAETPAQLFARLAPKRALVVLAHPDDNEFMCGGTVAMLARAGWTVDLIVATSGNKGTKDPDVTPQYLAGVREEEQRRAAAVLGMREPIYLGFPDGGVPDDDEIRGLLVRWIRRLRPTLAITWDGFKASFNHRDHRRVGQALYDAVYPSADDHLYHPEDKEEGLEPHRPDVLLLGSPDAPDFHVDIEPVIETKIRAVFEHTSQLGWRSREQMLEFWRERARQQGRAEGRDPIFVESFRKVEFGPFARRARDARPAGRSRRVAR